jgi:tetratricopeptide (TPR) repeat protein
MFRKNKRDRGALAIHISLAFMLAGCGSPMPPQSARHEQAIQANHQGESAFYRGDYSHALAYFNEALRIDTSIENVDGIATNRINLARTALAVNDDEQAQRHLDQLLKSTTMQYPPTQLAQASALQATRLFMHGNLNEALAYVDKGRAWCGSDCTAAASLSLLRAQIALRAAHADAAIEYASDALRRTDGRLHAEEKANALRVIGEAWMQKKDVEAAIARFEQALALDREAGLPHKIGIDLMHLAKASKLAHRLDDANTYFRRAAAVRSAAGDQSGAALALRNIELKE